MSYTIKLTDEEYQNLLNLFQRMRWADVSKKNYFLKMMDKAKKVENTEKLKKAQNKAREAKKSKTLSKIRGGIKKTLREQNKLSYYAISKNSGVSYQTLKKYIPDLSYIELNEDFSDLFKTSSPYKSS